MGDRSEAIPLTALQREVALALSANRAPDSYLAGGAGLHLEPNSIRYSNDLDYFHDAEDRVAEAYEEDRRTLEDVGFAVTVQMAQPGFIRALAAKGDDATKIEWAHDSAWRFLPPIENEVAGYTLHPVDLAVNKMLAVAGRDEPRDFLDLLDIHRKILSIGALAWAAAGKDPGFTPASILSLARRRGRYRQEDFDRLHLKEPVGLRDLKTRWLDALEAADRFVGSRPPEELGCLYYSLDTKAFVDRDVDADDVVAHFGRPGGVLPKIG